jgi:lipopolysaccharide transport system ATP-binding protein
MGKIVVSNLGKAYKVYPDKISKLFEWFSFGFAKNHVLKWVMQDISFIVQPGEAVGIIGINGAGKSTLLKMITGTTIPTTGTSHVTGRVTAMLELGMGFHPDFTGRQNVMMAGQMIGLSAHELSELMPEIENFAEIGDYIDQPVRIYSSGMQVRLAFSLATAKRPDILIVDEALSVGDAYFQHKSFDRIKQFRQQGTTLLFVSHDKGAIQAICDRAILINAGRFVMEGEPESVFNYYNALLADHQNQTIKKVDSESTNSRLDSGTFEAEIVNIRLLNNNNQEIKIVSVGESVRICIDVKANVDIPGMVLGIGIRDRLGQVIFGTNTFHTGQKLKEIRAGSKLQFHVDFLANLGVGSFSIQCAIVENDTHIDKNYHWIDRALVFEVINTNKPVFIGCAWNDVSFSVQFKNH